MCRPEEKGSEEDVCVGEGILFLKYNGALRTYSFVCLFLTREHYYASLKPVLKQIFGKNKYGVAATGSCDVRFFHIK